jgi:tetratricopeptide (TPR) repeat protein
MALHRPLLIRFLGPLLAFALTMTVVALIDRSSSKPAPPLVSAANQGLAGDGRSADKRIATLQAALRADPKNASGLASLADAYLQKVRETGDFALYLRAQTALERALGIEPRNPAALAGMGSLALSRHDFRAGLRYGQEAHAVAPEVVRIYGVIVDAQIELGRYDAAERTLQRMIDLKPNLSSYARVSYFRELHGDLNGALSAMRLAVSAGGQAPENVSYVQTLLGNLQFERGELPQATHSYRAALARFPHYPAAEAGLARVEAARGDFAASIRRYRDVTTRLPLPEHLIALGETELAAGHRAWAQREFATVQVEQRLIARSGVNTDVELALFNANHGDRERAVELARRAWAAAPSVRSADALGWTLTRSGRPSDGLAFARRALALGSKDPLFLYHAGMSAKAARRPALARRYLERSVALNPHFSPLYAPRARQALEALR